MSEVQIPAGHAVLSGNLTIPDNAVGLVLFAHGSGSSRHSPRNQFVAHTLNDAGLATLLFDLLTPKEEALDVHTREHRFNIAFARRTPRPRHNMGKTTGANTRFAGRLFRLKHGRSCGIGGSGRDFTRCRRCGFTWWTPRSGRRRVAKSPGADVAHRRWQRRHCNRAKRNGARSDALRSESWRLFPARRTFLRNRVRWRKWRSWQAIGFCSISARK